MNYFVTTFNSVRKRRAGHIGHALEFVMADVVADRLENRENR